MRDVIILGMLLIATAVKMVEEDNKPSPMWDGKKGKKGILKCYKCGKYHDLNCE